MNRVETTSGDAVAPSLPMSRVLRIIRGYVLWSYERGTIQYDVMVTLILLFVFLSPLWISFNDKPIDRNPHQISVAVLPDGSGGFIYQIDGSAVSGKDDESVRNQLTKIIEPIAGEISITKVEALRDHAGSVLTYKVWVVRE